MMRVESLATTFSIVQSKLACSRLNAWYDAAILSVVDAVGETIVMCASLHSDAKIDIHSLQTGGAVVRGG